MTNEVIIREYHQSWVYLFCSAGDYSQDQSSTNTENSEDTSKETHPILTGIGTSWKILKARSYTCMNLVKALVLNISADCSQRSSNHT